MSPLLHIWSQISQDPRNTLSDNNLIVQPQINQLLLQTFQYDGSLERLAKESEMLRQAYGHFFDLTIVNNDIGETIATLENAIDKVHSTAQWVPVSWLYWQDSELECPVCLGDCDCCDCGECDSIDIK